MIIMTYLIYLHIFCAFLSLALLLVRGVMQLNQRDWRAVKPLKILPHLSDTLLIASGLIVVFSVGYGFPWWILLKIGLLAVYVVFAAKFFSKKTVQAQKLHLGFAGGALLAAILVGYFQT